MSGLMVGQNKTAWFNGGGVGAVQCIFPGTVYKYQSRYQNQLPPPPTGYRIQDNKLGLTASLLAGREAKWLLPPIPPLDGRVVIVISYPTPASVDG